MTDKPKILIVDDKPENLYALEKLFKKLDVQVIQALSGAEALGLIVEHDFCVGIIDIQMPEMDGYELVELLRGYQQTVMLPVIFVSAIYSDEYHHRKGYEAGAVDFLSKPFIPEILLSKVQVFIDLYHQRRALQDEIERRRQTEAMLQDRNADLQELGYQLQEQRVGLLKLTDELEEKNIRLEKMTAALQDMNEQLTRLNADKDKLFSIISHDLRSPFTSFLGSAQFIAKKIDILSKEDIRDLAQSIYNEAKVVHNLLEHLLTWSRMQREGGIQYLPEPIELKSLAQGTIEILGNTAAQKEIELSNAIDEGIWVQADRPMVETVIRNLTNNALKFTPRGGKVTLTVSSNGLDKPSDLVTVAIQDNGVGISQDDIAKLFKINMQHTTMGTENERGSGLGLTICKEMVEQNKGQIWIESDGVPGHGTTVSFTLPRHFG